MSFVQKAHKQRLYVVRRFRLTEMIRQTMCGLVTRMAMGIVVRPNLKVKIVARQPVKHGTMACAELLARPRRRFLVPSVLTRGVVQRVTLVVHPSDNVASAEPVVRETKPHFANMKKMDIAQDIVVARKIEYFC